MGTNNHSAFALRIARDTVVVRGTSVLIHREDRGNDTILYFLTSSRLFTTPDGQRQSQEQTIHVLLDAGGTLEVKREDVFITGGNVLNVAVFRAVTRNTLLQPTPVVYDPPPAGSVFRVSGYDQNGVSTTVAEHIRFESTRLVIGDRDISGLLGCVGAPAISQEAVFGVVSECEANRCPVISLLTMARSFIERHVPASSTHAPPTR